MSEPRALVAAAIRATRFHSATSYSWFGERSQILPSALVRGWPPEAARGYLLAHLQLRLYDDFYCKGFAAPPTKEAARLPNATGPTEFVEVLSAANCGSGCWEPGWEVRAVGKEVAVVRRAGLDLHVRLDHCSVSGGTALAAGREASVLFAKESRGGSAGFYVARGDAPLTPADAGALIRLYWNIGPEGAVRFMRSATTRLNQAGLPFNLKVLSDPERFDRCDAVVVYVCKRDYPEACQLLGPLYPELGLDLKPAAPVFTKTLAPGVGLAEDPGPGESFGMSRCRLLAEGLVRARERWQRSLADRLRTVVDRFAQQGVSLEAPFLNPGSSDVYDVRPWLPGETVGGALRSAAPRSVLSSGDLLKAAEAIGGRLMREAVWHEDRCTWVALPGEGRRGARGVGGTHRPLGPELYAGTVGIAWFLADLYTATGTEAARRTARGAIRQALARANTVPPPERRGLYGGWSGIALAAARVGRLFHDDELLSRAARLARRAALQPAHESAFDLVSGSAGAIAALVVLREILEDTSLIDLAQRLGDELVRTACRTRRGWSWCSPGKRKGRNLTGFAHGTAGVGYALLELSCAAERADYRRVAERAFEYERALFDRERGNWPDLREDGGRAGGSGHFFAAYWCHGAPGITLSRIRAHELLGGAVCKAEAAAGARTTERLVEAGLRSRQEGLSLCHGLAGNAQVLLYASRVLEEPAGATQLALEVASTVIETAVSRRSGWGRETPLGASPGLLPGAAGLGHFLLGLGDPALPSVLLLRREDFIPAPSDARASSYATPSARPTCHTTSWSPPPAPTAPASSST